VTALGDGIFAFFRALGRLPRSIVEGWQSTSTQSGGFLTATLIGWGVELVYGLVSQGLIGGVRVFCLLWFASGAAFFVGTIAGFLFGVPKARTVSSRTLLGSPDALATNSDPQTNRDDYKDNTNLEEVSDWLTKIIVGLGLAQFNNILEFLGTLGTKIGAQSIRRDFTEAM
jgi:hypothetical protein